MENFNLKAIEKFGEGNIDMPLDSPTAYFDTRMGRLSVFLDLQLFKKWVFSTLPHSKYNKISLLDVGAGKGRMTVKFCKIVEHCVAIEPFPSFFQILKSNCFAQNVEIYQCTLLKYEKMATRLFDVIYISGVTPYLSEDELKEFFVSAKKLLHPWGIIIVREFGIIGGPTCQLEYEISHSIADMVKVFKEAGFSCLKWRRSYPPNIPWVCFRKWPNKITEFLWNIASMPVLFSVWGFLAKIKYPYRGRAFVTYLLTQ